MWELDISLPQRVWWHMRRKTSVVLHGCYVICTGWLGLFHGGCSTTLPWLFIGVLSTELHLKVPCLLLRVSLRSFRPPTSPFGQPSQTEYSTVSSQHIWHQSFRSRRFDGLELATDLLRDLTVKSERLRRDLKTHLFAGHERIRGVTVWWNRAV